MTRLILAAAALVTLVGCSDRPLPSSDALPSFYLGINAHYRNVAPGEPYGFENDPATMAKAPAAKETKTVTASVQSAQKACCDGGCKDGGCDAGECDACEPEVAAK